MARTASREVIESLGAYLRRSAALSHDDIGARMKDLEEGRMQAPDSSSEAFRMLAIPSAEAAVHAPIAFPEDALAAADVDADGVRARLAHLTDYVTTRVQKGELPCVDLPDLHQANSLYDGQGNVFLGHNVRRLAFDRKGDKTFMRLLLTLETAADNLRNGVVTTKRGLYYYHQAQLPDESSYQIDSDRALASCANLLGVRRKSLAFVESRRGTIYGRLVIRDGGVVIDLSKVGPAGHAIPRFMDDVEILSSDAAFIFIVEKQSVVSRLAQARWWDAARCILICGEGFPSLSTREYVRKLVDTLGIPALVCVDADPGGIRVGLTYAHGAISTALETPWLACNNIWWAGFYPSEIDRYFPNGAALIRLTETDYEAARLLIEHPSSAYVNQRIREELSILVDRGVKLELDALLHGRRLIDDYLPKKLLDSDLVKL